MAIKFYDSEHTLVACDEDGCAYWSPKSNSWEPGTVDLARECWLTLSPLSRGEAQAEFPDADLGDLPDLAAANEKAKAAYVPISDERLRELGVK